MYVLALYAYLTFQNDYLEKDSMCLYMYVQECMTKEADKVYKVTIMLCYMYYLLIRCLDYGFLAFVGFAPIFNFIASA